MASVGIGCLQGDPSWNQWSLPVLGAWLDQRKSSILMATCVPGGLGIFVAIPMSISGLTTQPRCIDETQGQTAS